MHFRIVVVAGLALIACSGFAQDINRAGEWKIKRAESPSAKVEVEMKRNGVYAVKGTVPKVVDERGFATTRKRQSNQIMSDDTEDAIESSTDSVMDSSAKNQFSAASEALVSDVKEEQKPFQVLFVLAAITTAFVVGFRLLARKIEVPEGALKR